MAPRRGSAGDFPYDERLQARNLRGLDRLRSIPDRKLAEYLYQLHTQAERNEAALLTKPSRPFRYGNEPRRIAARALAGELGPDTRELATYLLLDEAGRERIDDPSLGVFCRALQELRRSPR
jgi:hypothetical protein